MKQSIQLRLGQSLVMTPQLQQAIRLLQLSTAELNAEVQEALDSNMMLEIDEEQDLGRGTGTQNGEGEADRPAREAVPDADLKATDENITGDIPEELPVDSAWDDVFDTPVGASGGSSENAMEIENQRSAEGSLREHLLWQINLAPITEMDKVIAYAVVD
ncbi:MAG: RNA polymerase factor sigma-54, partial [Gammaproteobacteria bacterium]